MPNLDARDLRDRRRDGRTHARASRDGAGRNGRRDRRGEEAKLGQTRHSGRLLHRSRNRHRRPVARRGAPRGARNQGRSVPVHRQWPRDDQTRRGRLHARRRARRQPSRSRRAGRWRRTCQNFRPPSAWLSKWARGSRMSRRRSTPIPPWARPFRRRRSGRSDKRCIFESRIVIGPRHAALDCFAEAKTKHSGSFCLCRIFRCALVSFTPRSNPVARANPVRAGLRRRQR